MNLVCFSGLTAGGIVCDLLNRKQPIVRSNGTVDSYEHNIFKGLTPYLDEGEFNESIFYNQLKTYITEIPNSKDKYYGTHTHPNKIPDKCLKEFNEIVVITTSTKKCKWYKYLRFKNIHHYLKPSIESILTDYPYMNNCTEISFTDIVDGEFVNKYNLDIEHFEIWKKHNSYLYTEPSLKDLEEFNLLYTNYKDLYGTKRTSTTDETQ
jgi:hypothetical protein